MEITDRSHQARHLIGASVACIGGAMVLTSFVAALISVDRGIFDPRVVNKYTWILFVGSLLLFSGIAAYCIPCSCSDVIRRVEEGQEP